MEAIEMRPRFSTWVLGCAVGIALGRVVVGVVADVIMPEVVVDASNVESMMMVQRVVMLASGAVEGACIGVAQWLALRKHAEVSGGRWIGATVVGIALGWFVGTLTTVVEPAGEPAPGLFTIAFFALLTGVILGAITGIAQALAVRGRSPVRWAAASAIAWGLAMIAALGGSGLLGAGDRGPLAIAVNLGTGVTAGLLVGLVTGSALDTVVSPVIPERSAPGQKSTDTSV